MVMADSGAVRQARHEHHKRGDHSLCKPGRCSSAADRLPPLVIVPAAGELDPRAELEALARRLIGVTEADPQNTAAARALVDVLRAIPPLPEDLDPVERLQAEVAAADVLDRAGVRRNVTPIRGNPWRDSGHPWHPKGDTTMASDERADQRRLDEAERQAAERAMRKAEERQRAGRGGGTK
jgi:hypothetical protein